MNEFKQRLVHLHHCQGVSWNIIFTILKKDPQLQSLYDSRIRNHIPSPAVANTIQHDLQSKKIINTIYGYEQLGIHTLTIFDREYPPMLRETFKPPWVLYTKGDLSLLSMKRRLAVVGSRQATVYGRKSIELLFPKLIEQKLVIVSGLAAGIDASAHHTAIKLGGRTVGVIAGGFHYLYPKENEKLAHEMMRRHLVISEYPPNIKPQKWHFPMRNRIIAGISHGTLIVEAKKSSGSLITANYAVHEGREVFAVPGHILNPGSVGTNELIQQGAKLVLSAQDILEEFSYY
jgi:DNA processing protein